MKRLCLVVSLLIVLVLTGCSGSKTTSNGDGAASPAMAFDAFAQKYRHADLDAMMDDPSDFLSDFSSACGFEQRDPSAYHFDEEWGVDDSFSSAADDKYSFYRKEDVLFNLPVIYGAEVHERDDGSCHVGFNVEFDSGNWEVDYSVAKAVASYLLEQGEYEEIQVDSNSATEADLRKLFLDRSGFPKGFSVSFEDSFFLSFFCYEHLSTEHEYTTHFTLFP